MYDGDLLQDLNPWCNFAHNNQCSFAGVYQPDLPPPGNFGDFYGFGGFQDLWKFLEMPDAKVSARRGEGAGWRLRWLHVEL